MLMMCVMFSVSSAILTLRSWDTRAPKEPSSKIEAHEREILAVAFSLANDNLIVTGSADKVSSTILLS